MPRTYTKDKKSFLDYYEKPMSVNHLKQAIFWRDDPHDETKVLIEIADPSRCLEVKKELSLIKD